jgi:hypothetical protein
LWLLKMQVSLLQLVMWLEQVASYVHEVTHPSTPPMVLDVVRAQRSHDDVSQAPKLLTFKLTRGLHGKRRALVDVWLSEDDPTTTERVCLRGERDVEDLADLKDCICAKLSPALRTLNLLKLILKEHLRMIPVKGSPQHRLCIVPGDMEVWLDAEDRLNVRGGSCLQQGVRTYVADSKPPAHEKVFFFEDPFAVKRPGAVHRLMPGTMRFLSDVLGTLGFESLEEWGKPPMAEASTGKEEERSANAPSFRGG